MRVEAGGFAFDFPDALNAFVFDDPDPSKPTFQRQPMKKVDIIAEFPDADVYVEIKDMHDPSAYDFLAGVEDVEVRNRFNRLKSVLKYKYRDSYLSRYAENAVEKPVAYICLLTFANSLNAHLGKELRRELPVARRLRDGSGRSPRVATW